MKMRWFEAVVLILALLCAAVFFLTYYRTNFSESRIITTDRGSAATVSTVQTEEETLLDLNSATLEELRALPYISETVAQRILNYRVKIGGFSSVEELLDVKGISGELLDEIRAYITVGEG